MASTVRTPSSEVGDGLVGREPACPSATSPRRTAQPIVPAGGSTARDSASRDVELQQHRRMIRWRPVTAGVTEMPNSPKSNSSTRRQSPAPDSLPTHSHRGGLEAWSPVGGLHLRQSGSSHHRQRCCIRSLRCFAFLHSPSQMRAGCRPRGAGRLKRFVLDPSRYLEPGTLHPELRFTDAPKQGAQLSFQTLYEKDVTVSFCRYSIADSCQKPTPLRKLARMMVGTRRTKGMFRQPDLRVA
jgi:hypothetical protein